MADTISFTHRISHLFYKYLITQNYVLSGQDLREKRANSEDIKYKSSDLISPVSRVSNELFDRYLVKLT